jgi:hypothetical protein
VKWPPAWELVSCNGGSWKGAAIQRVYEQKSTGISTVKIRYQASTSEGTEGWKDLACALVFCEVWRLAMAL